MRNKVASTPAFKFKLIAAMVVIACCLARISAGQCKRWVQVAPDGGFVYSFAIDPLTPSKLYAGTYGALYRSTDGGATWTTASDAFLDTVVQSLVIEPGTPSTLYAGTYSRGVYRSTDRGEHWTGSNIGLQSMTVYSLAINPKTPSSIFAGTSDGVYRSDDSGIHWHSINGQWLNHLDVWSLAFDPLMPAFLYAGTEDGVYRTTDRAGDWTPVKWGIGQDAWSLAVDPTASSNVFAATERGLFRSSDRGDHWTAVDGFLGTLDVRSVAIDPMTPSTVYAVTYGLDVYRSMDRGLSWAATSSGMPSYATTYPVYPSLTIDPVTPSILYVAARGPGVFRSSNSGDQWVAVNTGLKAQNIDSLAIDPKTPSTLYAGTEKAGLLQTSDRGGHWTTAISGLGLADTSIRRVYALVIDPTDSFMVFAGTHDGIYFSTDQGANWKAVNNGLTDRRAFCLAIDPQNPATIYAGTLGGGVFRSDDRGAGWTATNSGLTSTDVRSLAIDPLTPSVLYAATSGGGVFRSTDRGGNWAQVSNGLASLYVLAMAIDPLTPSTLYAATAGGVFRTLDRGATWTPASSGISSTDVRCLAVDPVVPTTLYAATSRGVFLSSDQGMSWISMNSGLGNLNACALVIDPTNPAAIYVGTRGAGVFRMDLQCILHFSQFGKGLGLTSDIILTNPSTSDPVSGAIDLADDYGISLSIPLNGSSESRFSILPQGVLTLSTGELGELAVGSALVRADGPLGGVVRFSIPGIGIAGVGAGEPASGLITPVRRAAAGINTGVALSNPEVHQVTLDLMLCDREGQQVPGGWRTIEGFPARGHLARFIDELFPEAMTDAFEGTLIVKTDRGQIVATALELGPEPGQFTTRPVTALLTAGKASELFFAQFGTGQGFKSEAVLVNPRTDGSVSGTLAFHDEHGEALPVALVGSGQRSNLPFSIPPRGVLAVSTDGTGALNVGSAQVTADSPLAGVVRFQIPGIGIAGVGDSRPLTRLLIPVRRTAGGTRTGIALLNTGESPVNIVLLLRNTAGTLLPGGTATVDNFPARGHLARFVEELFPDADTQNLQGTVSVEVTGGTVAATALEVGSAPGKLTTLPVTPME